MKAKNILLIVIAIVVIIAVVFAATIAGSYNSTVNLRETINSKEAQVMNRLSERHAKMIQLLSAIEGLEEHAETIYEMITNARIAYTDAKTSEDYILADNLETQAITELRVLIESNPEGIVATGAYYIYMAEVPAMESALSVARRDYNEAVQKYNTSVKKFPKVLYISLFGFEKELPYWEINEGDEEIPLNN